MTGNSLPQFSDVVAAAQRRYYRAVMSKFAVILPAAGKSSRFTLQKKKKTFAELKGRAVWLRAAEHFVNRDDVVQTLVVLAPDDLEWFKEKFAPNLAFMNVELVAGGAERSDSVRNALARVAGIGGRRSCSALADLCGALACGSAGHILILRVRPI